MLLNALKGGVLIVHTNNPITMKKIIILVCILLTTILWAEELPKIEYDKLQVGADETLEVMT